MSQTALPWRYAPASRPTARPSVWERAARASGRLSPKEGWLIVLLVTSVLLVVIWSVERAHWVREAPALSVVVLGGVAMGLLAAKVRGPGALIHFLACLMGLLFVGWLMTGVVPGVSWEEHLVELVSRVLAWFLAAVRGGISNDSVPFGFFLAILAWAISYWSIWFGLRSRRAWLALGPSLVAMLVNLSHFPGAMGGLFALYMALALLVVVRINARRQQDTWERSRTDYGAGHSLNLFQEAIWATALLVLVAWLLPLPHSVPGVRTAWRDLTSPWTGAETQFGRLFANLRSSKNMPLHTFDTALPFRGQVNLGQNVVMTVAAEIPEYWRARTYDVYTSKGWLSSDMVTRPLEVAPEEPVVEEYQLQRPSSFTFEPLQPSNVIFTAGHPLEVSVPVRAERAREFSYVLDLQELGKNRDLPRDLQALAASLGSRQGGGRLSKADIEGSLPRDTRLLNLAGDGPRLTQLALGRAEPQFGNVLAVRAAQRPRSPYTVTAAVSVAEASQLRLARASYPGWVRDRYARLPDQLPTRVRELAQEVTREQANPYDKALAVQEYLRRLRYTFEVPTPPTAQDTVDWFLFDLKAGYCDYYASAFAVMMRSLGIPARVSVGYFTGRWDANLQRYVVAESDAHTWPEVYFPEYGWIRFEPTPARPALARGDAAALPRLGPGGELLDNAADPFLDEFLLMELLGAQLGGTAPPPARTQGAPWSIIWIVPLGLAVLAVVALLFFWSRGLGGLAPEARTYVQLTRLASWAGVGPQAGHTPHEFGGYLGRALPQVRQEIELVVGGYGAAVYGRRDGSGLSPRQRALGSVEAPSASSGRSLARAWTRLRWSLLWHATLGRLARKTP